MELMQKYVKEGGAVGIDDLRRWHSGSDAIGFLSATTSATSAAELLKVLIPAFHHLSEILIVTASPGEQFMAEGIIGWFNIISTGLLTGALQV